MKKSIIIFGLLFSVMSVTIVAAAATLPAPPLTISGLADFFKDLLSGSTGEDTLIRVLLIMLLTTVLFRPAFKLVGKKSGLAFIIALLVSIIGIKFILTADMIRGLMLPYGALAIALSAGIPFLLIGALIATSDIDMLLRKLFWGLMAGSFIMLWWFRWTDIGDLSYIYLGLGVISALILFFFDSTLRQMLSETALSNSGYAIDVQVARLNKEISDLYVLIGNTHDARARTRLENQVKDMEQTRTDLVHHRSRL